MATSGTNGQGGNAPQPARKPKVSAKVYRRRRQVVGVLALLVVAGLVAGAIALASFFGGLGASDAGTHPAGPSASAAGSASPTGTAQTKPAAKPATPPSGVCDEAGIKVSGNLDKASYAAGEDPKLTLRVTNTGQAPCNINVGTSQMDFKVTSGEDVVFSSRDCQADSTNLVKNLKAGASEAANFTWKRNRSAPGCAKVAATPGAGTYVFVATLGKWSSDKVIFELH
ncbi:hypothetical protein CVV68_19440 [Arthrobacter livingstonensis]|uniref:DUF4232 domain-containing protein n=1 Tax=Arthrobacter livingstonensis TaxID=670078 RepID=A0A2V5L3N7_9MICC|nr:hypothetical protein [Arthrobacter livingstonensis]PYI65102.1 hypothetical protein CVV68_19440 [Arthrobacter livingstonensis]